MDGVAHLQSWQWLFILQGVFSILIGLIGYLILPDFPHDTWACTESAIDRAVIMTRMQEASPPTHKVGKDRQGNSYKFCSLYIWAFVL